MQNEINLDIWRKVQFPSLSSNDLYRKKIPQNY